MKLSLKDVRFLYGIAKAEKPADSSQKYIETKLWINMSLHKDSSSKFQELDKLLSRRGGPFVVKELIGKNSARLELPDHFKNHLAVYVSQTMPFVENPSDIGQHVEPRPEPISTFELKEYIMWKGF